MQTHDIVRLRPFATIMGSAENLANDLTRFLCKAEYLIVTECENGWRFLIYSSYGDRLISPNCCIVNGAFRVALTAHRSTCPWPFNSMTHPPPHCLLASHIRGAAPAYLSKFKARDCQAPNNVKLTPSLWSRLLLAAPNWLLPLDAFLVTIDLCLPGFLPPLLGRNTPHILCVQRVCVCMCVCGCCM